MNISLYPFGPENLVRYICFYGARFSGSGGGRMSALTRAGWGRSNPPPVRADSQARKEDREVIFSVVSPSVQLTTSRILPSHVRLMNTLLKTMSPHIHKIHTYIQTYISTNIDLYIDIYKHRYLHT